VHRADRIRRPVVQVGEQLPVAELPGRAVRCMYGSAGLAHSALAGDPRRGPGASLRELMDRMGHSSMRGALI
jgi:hypothetical protein